MNRIEQLASSLLRARRDGTQIDARLFAGVLQSAEDAFEVQEQVHAALERPGVPRAWKSGGPSRSGMLTHSPLPAAGVLHSPAAVRKCLLHQCRIEAEIALRLRRDVTAAEARDVTVEAASGWIDAMACAIEIVDTRWKGAGVDALLKLADHQSHASLVVGNFVPWRDVAWERQVCTVTIAGQTPKVFTGTHSLRNPAWLLPTWLRHATRNHQNVRAETAVTTGTWCGMLPAQAGDRVRAVFEGVGEAEVQL